LLANEVRRPGARSASSAREARAAAVEAAIAQITLHRPGFSSETYVHLAREPSSGAWRAIAAAAAVVVLVGPSRVYR